MKAKLVRKYNEKQTPGNLGIYDYNGNLLEIFATIELKWDDNKTGESCIPAGRYKVTKEKHWKPDKYSKTDGCFFAVHDVPNRSGIQIHYANYSRQLRGCIAPGYIHKDIDNDGLVDVTKSVDSMKKLLKLMPDEFELEII